MAECVPKISHAEMDLLDRLVMGEGERVVQICWLCARWHVHVAGFIASSSPFKLSIYNLHSLLNLSVSILCSRSSFERMIRCQCTQLNTMDRKSLIFFGMLCIVFAGVKGQAPAGGPTATPTPPSSTPPTASPPTVAATPPTSTPPPVSAPPPATPPPATPPPATPPPATPPPATPPPATPPPATPPPATPPPATPPPATPPPATPPPAPLASPPVAVPAPAPSKKAKSPALAPSPLTNSPPAPPVEAPGPGSGSISPGPAANDVNGAEKLWSMTKVGGSLAMGLALSMMMML